MSDDELRTAIRRTLALDVAFLKRKLSEPQSSYRRDRLIAALITTRDSEKLLTAWARDARDHAHEAKGRSSQ